jgi:osmotically-inducible protein OsmY
MRSFRSLFTAGLVGAGLAYFLDPDRGKRRRNVTRDRLQSVFRRAGGSAKQTASYVGGTAAGKMAATGPRTPDNPNPDDLTLRDRVESELFRDPSVPKGELNIDVVDGIVELRGEVQTQQEIDDLIKRARNVQHVKGVESYLHLPGTPAPNKESALRVS